MSAQEKSLPALTRSAGLQQLHQSSNRSTKTSDSAPVSALTRPLADSERDERNARQRFLDALEASGLSYSLTTALYAAGDAWSKARALHMVAFVAASGAEA